MPLTLKELRLEASPMLRIAAPIVLGELGWVTMNVVDIIMVGHLPDSATAIAAVGFGSNLYIAVTIFGIGLLLGLDTLVAQSFGRNDVDDCHHTLLSALYFTIAFSPLLVAVIWFGWPLIASSGYDPALLQVMWQYLNPLLWSTVPLLVFIALRRYLQAMNIVMPVMLALLTANIMNAVCNWIFVYGHWGAPAMGAPGSGWATCISRIYMCIFLFVAAIRADHEHGVSMIQSFARRGFLPDFTRIIKIAKLGLPAALQLALEVGVFVAATALIAKLGAVQLAGNQVALVTVTTTYMVPLGVSSAAAVRVGQAFGRHDLAAARRAGWMAITLGTGFMLCSAFVLWTVPQWIAHIFTTDVATIAASIPLLAVAAVFQIFDGIQVVSTGALRGIGDTHSAMFASLMAYWVIGLPVGSWLCFSRGMGATGLWIGLCIGLIIVASGLLLTWHRKMAVQDY